MEIFFWQGSLNETVAASYMSSLPYPSRIKSQQIDNTHQMNRKKAAKNMHYLQMVNQLRRNVFNLDFKREIVAASAMYIVI